MKEDSSPRQSQKGTQKYESVLKNEREGRRGRLRGTHSMKNEQAFGRGKQNEEKPDSFCERSWFGY